MIVKKFKIVFDLYNPFQAASFALFLDEINSLRRTKTICRIHFKIGSKIKKQALKLKVGKIL